jgi:hypothetical protein
MKMQNKRAVPLVKVTVTSMNKLFFQGSWTVEQLIGFLKPKPPRLGQKYDRSIQLVYGLYFIVVETRLVKRMLRAYYETRIEVNYAPYLGCNVKGAKASE